MCRASFLHFVRRSGGQRFLYPAQKPASGAFFSAAETFLVQRFPAGEHAEAVAEEAVHGLAEGGGGEEKENFEKLSGGGAMAGFGKQAKPVFVARYGGKETKKLVGTLKNGHFI